MQQCVVRLARRAAASLRRPTAAFSVVTRLNSKTSPEKPAIVAIAEKNPDVATADSPKRTTVGV